MLANHQSFLDVLYFAAKFAPVFVFAAEDGFVELGPQLLGL